MLNSVGISADTERLARSMFSPEQVPDALEIVAWYDDEQAEDVRRAVLTLSKGDVGELLNLVAAAVTDFRDVLMWASQPEPTPGERAAVWARSPPLQDVCLIEVLAVTPDPVPARGMPGFLEQFPQPLACQLVVSR